MGPAAIPQVSPRCSLCLYDDRLYVNMLTAININVNIITTITIAIITNERDNACTLADYSILAAPPIVTTDNHGPRPSSVTRPRRR